MSTTKLASLLAFGVVWIAVCLLGVKDAQAAESQPKSARLHRISLLAERQEHQLAVTLCKHPHSPFAETVALQGDLEKLIKLAGVMSDKDADYLDFLRSNVLRKMPPASQTVSPDAVNKIRGELEALVISRDAFEDSRQAAMRVLSGGTDQLREVILKKVQEKDQNCDSECVASIGAKCMNPGNIERDDRVVPAPAPPWTPPPSGEVSAPTKRVPPEKRAFVLSRFTKEVCEDKTNQIRFRRSCKALRYYGAGSGGSADVLLSTAVRLDLEELPSTLSQDPKKPDIAARVLFRLMREIRDGQSPIGLLAGLNRATRHPELSKASLLISLYGDILLVSDPTELEDLLPHVASQIQGYLASCRSPAEACAIGPVRDSVGLIELGRRIYETNEMALTPDYFGDQADYGYLLLSATLETLQTALTVLKAKVSHETTERWDATAQMLVGRYAEGILALEREKCLGPVRTHLPLLVGLAGQKTPQAVDAVIDSVAAPVTWRAIKSREMTIGFGASLGLAATLDVPWDADDDLPNAIAVGLTASAGMDITFPLRTSYLGIYLPMVDVGQLASTPLVAPNQTDTTRPTTSDNIQVSQILAPGLFLRWAVPSTAMVIQAGASYSPRFRKYEKLDSEGQVVDSALYDTLRFGVGFCFDAPLVRFR